VPCACCFARPTSSRRAWIASWPWHLSVAVRRHDTIGERTRRGSGLAIIAGSVAPPGELDHVSSTIRRRRSFTPTADTSRCLGSVRHAAARQAHLNLLRFELLDECHEVRRRIPRVPRMSAQPLTRSPRRCGQARRRHFKAKRFCRVGDGRPGLPL